MAVAIIGVLAYALHRDNEFPVVRPEVRVVMSDAKLLAAPGDDQRVGKLHGSR